MNCPPHIHGRWRSFSVSSALDAIGDTLGTIRKEDALTWKEVGRILGKSDDRAADYSSAISEMPVGAFLLGCREWNGRFANPVLAQIGMKLTPLVDDGSSDAIKLTRILRLAHQLADAIADQNTPGEIDSDELDRISTADLDAAEHAIAAIRARKASNVVVLGSAA